MTEHIFHYTARRKGYNKLLETIFEDIKTVESLETNNSRRYKLLISRIERYRDEIDTILCDKERKIYKYRFEKGKLILTEVEE